MQHFAPLPHQTPNRAVDTILKVLKLANVVIQLVGWQ